MKPIASLRFVFTFVAAFILSAIQGRAEMPKVGDTAPLVEGKDQDGKEWKLADQLGKKVVLLYFYPKDDTPGCTKEACGLKDRMGDLQKSDVEVVGVSFDSAESHVKFIQK
jgi:peroxiredoxin Q/BCP